MLLSGVNRRIQKPGQLLGIETFGDCGEAAHVAEQQRHVAGLAAEFQLGRVGGETRDEGGRHVMREGMANPVSLPLGAQENKERAGKVDGGERDGGIDRIDQPAERGEGVPGDANHRRNRRAAKYGAAQRAGAIDQHGDDHAKGQNVDELGGRGEIGPLQIFALQDLLDGLSVQLDAGHGGFERRRSQVEEALRRWCR